MITHKIRALRNATNVMLTHFGAKHLVVSGFPKTGTTYLSILLANLTGLEYLQGSKKITLRAHLIHTHFRFSSQNLTIYAYRDFESVFFSYICHLIGYTDPYIYDRLSRDALIDHDFMLIKNTYKKLRYAKSSKRNAKLFYEAINNKDAVFDVGKLSRYEEEEMLRLSRKTKFMTADIKESITFANNLQTKKRNNRDPFYVRPTSRLRKIVINMDYYDGIWS